MTAVMASVTATLAGHELTEDINPDLCTGDAQ